MEDTSQAEAKVIKPTEEEPDLQPSFIAMVAESLFVILPLIVLTIVLLLKGEGIRKLFSSPEWSFGGAVLMGQTVVKVVYAISSVRTGRVKNAEQIQLVTAVIIVLGLVPSLIILSLMLTTEMPSTGMVWSQVILFLFGLVIFLVVGMMAHWIIAMDRLMIVRGKTEGKKKSVPTA